MKPLIVANWKCNPSTLAEAKKLFNSVKKGIKDIKEVEVVVCPPFIFIPEIQDTKYKIQFGAQDCFWQEGGPFTGEISPLMLKSSGARYVILGHSERRRNFNETDEMVQKKLKAVLVAGLKPILCIGSKNREQKREFKEMEIQLARALSGVEKGDIRNIVFTYEPVWAISTSLGGRIASPREAKEGAQFIRKILSKLFGVDVAREARIIYGGSVDSKNVLGFVREGKVDGVLVGAASLNAKEFVGLARNAART